MEPFGLFNLLNSLLSVAPKSNSESVENDLQTGTAPPPSETKKEEAPLVAPSNACAEFFMRHEQRAKRK